MRILIVIILLFHSLELLSEETINDSINPSCNINKYNEHLIGNTSIKYALNFNNRKFAKEVIKKLTSNATRFSLGNNINDSYESMKIIDMAYKDHN